jgi:hypothetical protein
LPTPPLTQDQIDENTETFIYNLPSGQEVSNSKKVTKRSGKETSFGSKRKLDHSSSTDPKSSKNVTKSSTSKDSFNRKTYDCSSPEVPLKIQKIVDDNSEEQAVSELEQNSAGDVTEKPDYAVDDTCAVCLDTYKNNMELRRLPCKHNFHVECADRWLKEEVSKGKCPVCRTPIIEEDEERMV